MKKITNKVDDIVVEMLQGMQEAYGDRVELDTKYKIVKRKQLNKEKVTIISGGGSGHEPAHAGFVGTGMLDAAVCGDVFASPSITQVYKGICQTESSKGTLLIIKNYSGDCMNFDAAAEMAEEDDDIQVRKVYVNDDVAVKDSLYTVGRRGVAGTILVHKIAGAAAERGMELDDVERIANKVIENVRTMGFALTSCTVPAKGSPTFKLEEDEIEFGVGIHGEPGVKREKLRSADELVGSLLERILNDSVSFEAGDDVALIVNGLGGTPAMELFVLNASTSATLKEKGLNIYKTFVGTYMSSIDMAGASLTLLKLDDELKELLDDPTDTPVSFK